MILQNDICNVNISIDTTYTVESTDNKPYDLVLNPRRMRHNDMYRVFAIRIDLPYKTLNIALIGDFYSYVEDCAVLEGEILSVLQNDAVVQLNIKNGTVINYKELDSFGCNYGIYRVQNGYIIYGEIEITMLDLDLNKKWSFSGKDIFVSIFCITKGFGRWRSVNQMEMYYMSLAVNPEGMCTIFFH